jgi:Kef-type K+ transport system membrane component KefB
MRRVLVLIALLALMLGVRLLKLDGLGSHDALVLGAIGFVLLASFTVAEMGGLLSLPRVTGYIITGALLSFFGILSPPVVLEMKMFNTLALGLIALAAGLELSLKQLGDVIKTLTGTIVAKLLFVVPLVAGTFYLYQTHLSPLALESKGEVIALALVLGALSLGTSPSISLAIISETKSKGRLTDIVLGAAVLKDLVVVVALALSVAVARPLLADGPVAPFSLSHVLAELGLSLLAGGLLGVLLILYVRYIKAEMLLFVAAMILVVAEIAQLLHLELLLVFIAGGFVVRNFSKYEHDLLGPVQMVSLPVFVVFFTIAGASVDLAATWHILPLALSLCVVRAGAYYFSAKVGNAFGKEGAAVQENAWLGYLPQAGVTLGLVGLATQQLPEVQGALLSTGMAVVAVNLLIGPITLRAALTRAGEVPSASTEPADCGAFDEEGGGEGPSVRPLERLPEGIRPHFLHIEKQLAHYFESQLVGPWERWASKTSANYRELFQDLAEGEGDVQAKWTQIRPSKEVLEGQSEECRELYLHASKIVRGLPEIVAIPLEDANRQVVPSDSFGVRSRKRLAALGRVLSLGKRPSRRIPVRALGRLHFEPRIAEVAALLFSSRMRLEAALLEELSSSELEGSSREGVETALRERVQSWKSTLRSEVNSLSGRALSRMVREAQIVDTAYLGVFEVRASGADKDVRSALSALGDHEGWQRALDADFARLWATQRCRKTRARVKEHFKRGVLLPSRAASSELVSLLTGLCSGLREFSETASQSDQILAVDLAEAFEKQEQALRECVSQHFEVLTAKYRATLDLRGFSHTLEELVDDLPEKVILPRAEVLPSLVRSSAQLLYRSFEFREVAHRLLCRKAMTDIESEADVLSQAPRDASGRILTCAETARIDIRAAAHEADSEALRAKIVDRAVELSLAISEISVTLSETLSGGAQRMESALSEQLEALDGQLAQEGSAFGVLVGETPLEVLRRAVTRRITRGKLFFEDTSRRGLLLLRRVLASELTTEIQAKYAAGDLDAGSVRTLLKAYQADPSLGTYADAFDPAPLRDPAYFVGHRAVLKELLAAERAWLKGGPSSCLIVGTAGSGRTSLLNLMQHGSYSQSLVRPSPFDWKRRVGLAQALAHELGCRPRPSAIEKALAGRQALVIIDDLEEWLPLGVDGLMQLRSFLDLVVRTNQSTFWVVTVGSSWFELVTSLSEIADCFGRVLHLGPVSADELGQVVESRHALTGRTIEYPSTWLSLLTRSERGHRDRDVFFRLLFRVSGGNLTRARDVWLHMAQASGDDKITIRLSRAFVLGLPFLHHLTPEQLALLVSLTRCGPLSEQEAATELGADEAEVRRHASFLLTSGLIHRGGGHHRLLEIPVVLAPLVETGLREVKAL